MITLTKFLEEAKKKKKKLIPQDPDLPKGEGSKPKKYHVGLSKAKKKARDEHFKANRHKADNDPSAYEAAPGDEKGPKKKSKWTEKVEKRYGKMKNEEIVPAAFEDLDYLMAEDLLYEDMDTALANKAKQTGYPKGLLKQIYNRGMAAFKGGHRPGANQHSWSMGRVNSVIAGGPARKSDKDIWAKMQAAKKKKKKSTKKK